jgi:hypothetical protein
VPATSAGLEMIDVEVIQPKLDEPTLPCAFDLAVTEAISKFHARTGSAIVTPPNHTCRQRRVKKYFIDFNHHIISKISL